MTFRRREAVEHAVVEQRRELMAHAVGRGDRGEEPQLLHVLPRAHAHALGPLRFEGRMDGERNAEILRGREHRVVVRVPERSSVMGERRHVRTPRSFADRPLELGGRGRRDH